MMQRWKQQTKRKRLHKLLKTTRPKPVRKQA